MAAASRPSSRCLSPPSQAPSSSPSSVSSHLPSLLSPSCVPRTCTYYRIHAHTRTHDTYTSTYTPRTHTHTYTIINQSVRFDFVQATSLNFPIRCSINETKTRKFWWLSLACLAPSNGSVRSISSKFLYHGMFGIEKGRGRY